MMFGNGKSAEERQREKERKKRGARKYGQAGFKQSRRGIISCWCAAAAILILAGSIAWAFAVGGNAPGIVGGIAVIALVLSVSGIRMAIRGFRERERSYLTCKIGLPANAAALILFFVIFIGGLR